MAFAKNAHNAYTLYSFPKTLYLQFCDQNADTINTPG